VPRRNTRGLCSQGTAGKECTKLLTVDGRVVPKQVGQLSFDHEVADTRLMLHAAHAPKLGLPNRSRRLSKHRCVHSNIMFEYDLTRNILAYVNTAVELFGLHIF
jgi:hypothetical protein